MNTTDNKPTYFNLNIKGVGYLNNSRLVEPKNGSQSFEPYLALDVVAVHGNSENTSTVRFSCRVVGSKAIELVKQYQSDIEDREKSVWASFTLGDLKPETFVYGAKSERAGETGISLSSRLLSISSITIDGERVFSAKDEVSEGDAGNAASEEISSDNSDNVAQISEAETSASTTDETPEEGEAYPFDEQVGNVVKLSVDEPDFEAKKTWLKSNGYKWDKQAQAWELPQAKKQAANG